ncbi:hypothetical protein EIJ81_00315 (plasmid) [Aliivibrio salmonicida]|uniref:hypothetical protein n=1 Tax=Aliivibrio salmonicida TaxID=40269 RepID=UPI000F6D0C1A|nr:hypothetical protein [Aliivibrio salmonicida]AZL83344.1 hypothetical protein EIJ81_00315 [Aliivibrio salmonicida]
MSLNVMWLSDMLHNLWKLGGALQSSDTSEVIAAIEYMEAYWKAHIEEVESARKNSKIDEWTLEDGFDILRRLRGYIAEEHNEGSKLTSKMYTRSVAVRGVAITKRSTPFEAGSLQRSLRLQRYLRTKKGEI